MADRDDAQADVQRLIGMISGMVPAQAIFVAAELGIADLLAEGPKSIDALAHATGADADALHRVLRMLAGEGIFAQDDGGRYALTPIAALLRSDSPTHLRDFARMMGDESARAFAALLHTVRTGECAFDHVHGAPIFDHLSRHPDKARIFDGAMTGVHGPETVPIVEACDFDRFETIVDVGGASGGVLLEILARCPRPRGIVFDLPGVAAQANERLAGSPLAARCRAEGGSFFDRVPAGADCYFLRHILHDWDDERAVAILRRCAEAMRPDGRILVAESVLPEGNVPHPGKMLDVIMLAIPGGRERTAAQYERLLDAAGLQLRRILPTASPVSVIEAGRK